MWYERTQCIGQVFIEITRLKMLDGIKGRVLACIHACTCTCMCTYIVVHVRVSVCACGEWPWKEVLRGGRAGWGV